MVRTFIHLGDNVSVSGQCEVAVTAKTRLGLVALRKCGELLCGKNFL